MLDLWISVYADSNDPGPLQFLTTMVGLPLRRCVFPLPSGCQLIGRQQICRKQGINIGRS